MTTVSTSRCRWNWWNDNLADNSEHWMRRDTRRSTCIAPISFFCPVAADERSAREIDSLTFLSYGGKWKSTRGAQSILSLSTRDSRRRDGGGISSGQNHDHPQDCDTRQVKRIVRSQILSFIQQISPDHLATRAVTTIKHVELWTWIWTSIIVS